MSIPVWEWVQGKITKMQAILEQYELVVYPAFTFLPELSPSQSWLVISSGYLYLLSPCKVWNKLLSTWLAKPIVGHSQVVSPNNFWKSLRVLKWSFLICTFCDLSCCRLILGNKKLIEATRYIFFQGWFAIFSNASYSGVCLGGCFFFFPPSSQLQKFFLEDSQLGEKEALKVWLPVMYTASTRRQWVSKDSCCRWYAQTVYEEHIYLSNAASLPCFSSGDLLFLGNY